MKQKKPETQRYPMQAAGYGLPRLFWLAPVMFLLGLAIRQSPMMDYLLPANHSAAAKMLSTDAAPLLPTSTSTPLPALLVVAPEISGKGAAVSPATEPTPVPLSQPSPTPEIVLSHLSFYWPPLGNINCDYECEHIANGDVWQKWVGKGVACPTRYPLGTIFVIMGDEWECVDRGEAIVIKKDGSIWLDMLLPAMPKGVAWGAIQPVEIRRLKATPTPKSG
ncbi:MAG TPA: hypothetical protein VMT46_12895 [Anaerolineaceae bacterium]|nr:hypothetical protein [Anaerolineaceae bacterium]